MRFLIAAVLFVLAIGSLLFGLAERTIWAPEPYKSISAFSQSDEPFIYIPSEVLQGLPDAPVVSTSSVPDGVFLAYGRDDDIRAWLGDTSHAEVTYDSVEQRLDLISVPGDGDSASPLGSDLWQFEKQGEGAQEIKTLPEPGIGVLIASDGFAPAPSQVKLTWPVGHDLTPSNVAIAAGSFLLLLAIVFNFLALMHLRRTRGPRRKYPKPPKAPRYRPKGKSQVTAPPKGRRSVRKLTTFAAGSAVLPLLLGGCALVPASDTDLSPSPSASGEAPVAETIPPVVTQLQLERILFQIAEIAQRSDAERDDTILNTRFAGPALQVRAVHYQLQVKSPKVANLPAVVSEPISFSLPAASTSWPRHIMVVTDEYGSEALPQMLVLQQDSPRSQYKVWYLARLLPGVEIPAVATSDIGAIPVEPSSQFLLMQPIDVVQRYGDLIDRGVLSEYAELFDYKDDEFYRQVSEAQRDQVEKLKRANITFSHRLGDENVISLATADAGALVATYMTDTYLIKPKKRGTAVSVTGQERILLGAVGSTKGVRSTYGDILLFYVPSATSEKRYGCWV